MNTATTSLVPPRNDYVNGVVYTPQAIAMSIVAALRSIGVSVAGRTLEPSVGDGAFISALHAHNGNLDKLVAIDIDRSAIEALALAYPEASFHNGEFLEFFLNNRSEKFDLIIGNPPYIRIKNFDESFADRLNELSKLQEFPRGALKNAWAAFVVASEALLAEDGAMAFVVPYELLNVNYGITLQESLFPRFSRVDILVPDEKAFKEIDQDAVVVIARKQSTTSGVYVHKISSLEEIEMGNGISVNYGDARHIAASLKGFLLGREVSDLIKRIATEARTVGDYCRSHTGIVTAANDFFILSDSDVERHGLEPWARPILKRSAYLPDGPIFSADDYRRLSETHPSKLIDFSGIDRGDLSPCALTYVEYGETIGTNTSYKARHRKTWYQVPITEKSSGFFFKRSYAYPRICINSADVYVTDTAYVLHMTEGASIQGLSYSFYNTITLLFAEIDGRFYGGGVLELTPKEFRGLPLYYTEPTHEQFEQFANGGHWADPVALAGHGDRMLVEKHGFSEDEIEMLRQAWRTVRLHRLRHGSAAQR